MSPYTRRDFIKTSIAAGTIATMPSLSLHAAARTATDKVTLGKSGMQVTRLAFGTGTNNGYVQAALGQQEFTRQVRYAYDANGNNTGALQATASYRYITYRPRTFGVTVSLRR